VIDNQRVDLTAADRQKLRAAAIAME